jgi:hypothetical protein
VFVAPDRRHNSRRHRRSGEEGGSEGQDPVRGILVLALLVEANMMMASRPCAGIRYDRIPRHVLLLWSAWNASDSGA